MSELIDVNVNLSRWPFRRLPCDDTPALVKKLREHHVTQAWAGTFDGLLHKDISSANARLAKDCHEHGRGILIPFGSINPTLPDWEEDLRRCHEVHQMRGVRLNPNYHRYKLNEPIFARLLDAISRRGLIVQLAVSMEDIRSQNPLVQVPNVDITPLPDLVNRFPKLKIVLLNALQYVNHTLFRRLAESGRVFADIGTLETVGGIGKLLSDIPAEQILFGSHAPFFYLESALLKLKESELTEAQSEKIRVENAKKLLEQFK